MNDTTRNPRKKNRRRVWIAVIAVIIIAAIVGGMFLAGRGARAVAATEPATTTLAKTDIERVITTTGKLQSQGSREVHSTLSYEISEVYVEVGSWVEEGQNLCRLDTANTDEEMVTAPISGTVTAMTAEVGDLAGGSTSSMSAMGAAAGTSATSTAGGALFTIEDTENLEIVATVAEYDMVLLETGLPADITSDALVDGSWEGTLTSISPAATDENSNFTVVVELASPPGQLAIGMSAKVNLIVEQKQDVYAVPYDAITTNEAGESVVYAWEPAGSDSGPAESARREIVVETGMESDYLIEITSDELTDGMTLLADPEGRNEQESTGSGFPMMGGGS